MSGKLPKLVNDELVRNHASRKAWVEWFQFSHQLDKMHEAQCRLDAFHNACCEAGVVFDYGPETNDG